LRTRLRYVTVSSFAIAPFRFYVTFTFLRFCTFTFWFYAVAGCGCAPLPHTRFTPRCGLVHTLPRCFTVRTCATPLRFYGFWDAAAGWLLRCGFARLWFTFIYRLHGLPHVYTQLRLFLPHCVRVYHHALVRCHLHCDSYLIHVTVCICHHVAVVVHTFTLRLLLVRAFAVLRSHAFVTTAFARYRLPLLRLRFHFPRSTRSHGYARSRARFAHHYGYVGSVLRGSTFYRSLRLPPLPVTYGYAVAARLHFRVPFTFLVLFFAFVTLHHSSFCFLPARIFYVRFATFLLYVCYRLRSLHFAQLRSVTHCGYAFALLQFTHTFARFATPHCYGSLACVCLVTFTFVTAVRFIHFCCARAYTTAACRLLRGSGFAHAFTVLSVCSTFTFGLRSARGYAHVRLWLPFLVARTHSSGSRMVQLVCTGFRVVYTFGSVPR